ncbi:MAG: carboxypeptidase M32, partial [candidate division Zixibacteria bacterium]|nr:carboxypeptidase M32 [candidate division Zixibacteria bacterium]
VLQDIHWSGGMVGYFPTYMLGNLYSAQMLATIKKALPGLEQDFEQGNFTPLLKWLREKVHRWGLVHEAPALIKKITGEGLNPRPWLEYIKSKFGEVYQVKLDE